MPTRPGRSAWLLFGLASGLVATAFGAPAIAAADEPMMCRILGVDLTPAEIADIEPMRTGVQIVAWVEDSAGTYVDTVYITAQTGTYGIGNRPGRFDFNSGPLWPYGRRTTVFPVWARRHGILFPEVVFQSRGGTDDNDLSHPSDSSSREHHFCGPMQRAHPLWDAGTCASVISTDKGKLGPGTSHYPPRSDLVYTPGDDDPSVEMFAMLNPFDAVSQATPANGSPASISWLMPNSMTTGDYVLWVEVSREFDHNATYDETTYPSPMVSWGDYGEAYRGQPSVLYKVPFTIDTATTSAVTLDYVGYGDPDGLDGHVRSPDSTITTGVSGSGAERLAVRADGGVPYRVRVIARSEPDFGLPAPPQDAQVVEVTSSAATVSFVAPGDDGLTGSVTGYEVRYVVGSEITEASFAAATPVLHTLVPGEPGTVHTLTLDKLLYATEHAVAIRAIDDCRNAGPIMVVRFATTEREVGEVDACFIATAAYGSAMAPDVAVLRRFRDAVLRQTVLGELAVATYYTFGPAVAGVVGESEVLRASARAAIAPIVGTLRP